MQLQQLKVSDQREEYGHRVAMYDDVIVVGEHLRDLVHVFVQNNTTQLFDFRETLQVEETDGVVSFGQAVAVSSGERGTHLLVGLPLHNALDQVESGSVDCWLRQADDVSTTPTSPATVATTGPSLTPSPTISPSISVTTRSLPATAPTTTTAVAGTPHDDEMAKGAELPVWLLPAAVGAAMLLLGMYAVVCLAMMRKRRRRHGRGRGAPTTLVAGRHIGASAQRTSRRSQSVALHSRQGSLQTLHRRPSFTQRAAPPSTLAPPASSSAHVTDALPLQSRTAGHQYGHFPSTPAVYDVVVPGLKTTGPVYEDMSSALDIEHARPVRQYEQMRAPL